jgi:4-diphosphocytidyl-2C-methyl-D-erythritol kinase
LPGARARSTVRPDRKEGLELARAALRNDLEVAALAAVPALVPWRACLDRAGLAAWRLSGSGSAWFGLHASRAEAESALAALRAELSRAGLAARFVSTSRTAGHGARLAGES